MTYKQAYKAYRKVGAAHATGEGYRAMLAHTIESSHGGNAEKYFDWLKPASDSEMLEQAKILLKDRAKAWDVLLDIPVYA